MAQVSVLHRDGHRELVVTDGSWRVRKGAWLPGTQRDLEGDLVDFTENINGPDEPVGWQSPGFDDSTWARATVFGSTGVSPWRHLVPVRTRIVEEPVAALTLNRLASGAVVADFGKVYAAVPTVTFHQGTPGRLVTMRAGYLLDEPVPGQPFAGVAGQVSTAHGTQHTDMSYSYVQRGGDEEFHPFDYLGFRYFQIDDPGETLTPADVVARTRHAAVPDEHAAIVRVVVPGRRRRVRAGTALGPLRSPGAVDRHAHTGEGPLVVGRVQRVPDRHGGLRRAEPHPQVAARVRRVPTPLLEEERLDQQDLPDRPRRRGHQRVHRDLSRVGVAVLDAHR